MITIGGREVPRPSIEQFETWLEANGYGKNVEFPTYNIWERGFSMVCVFKIDNEIQADKKALMALDDIAFSLRSTLEDAYVLITEFRSNGQNKQT